MHRAPARENVISGKWAGLMLSPEVGTQPHVVALGVCTM
jgi:hypothetical protein